MNFQESIIVCFKKYADFEGRASRSELWWFLLFQLLAVSLSLVISLAIEDFNLYAITWFALFIPALAAMIRRLHDTNKSGWNYCWSFTGIGAIPVLVWLCQKGDKGKNKFGTIKIFNEKSPSKKKLLKKNEAVYTINTFGEVSAKSFYIVILFITCLLLFLLFSVNHDLKNKNFNTKFESVKKVLEANKNKRISECYDNAPRHTWDDIDCSGKEQ